MSPKEKKKNSKRRVSIAEVIGGGIAVGLVALGGGPGVAAVFDVINGQEVPPEACVRYWDKISDLKEAGFTGFDLMDADSELANRCGPADEVADAWVEIDKKAP